MKSPYTTSFDTQLKDKVIHYVRFPEMLPYIGENWDSTRTILLGESHYIDKYALQELFPDRDCKADWYDLNSLDFNRAGIAGYISTRQVVEQSDDISEHGFVKTYTLFYNMKEGIRTANPDMFQADQLFPQFVLYNYFQRPAFEDGESIVNNSQDNRVAYDTLKTLVSILEPRSIIFVSSKGFDAFWWSWHNDPDKSIFDGIQIDGVPHAGCAWWNKAAVKYGSRTGREKFIDLIKMATN